MNREIKFRAWSKATEKMSDWDFIHSVKNLHKLMTLNHVELMQFTGLTDKNGKEIFEGDIVKHKFRRIWQTKEHTSTVIWCQEYCCYYLFDGICNHRMRDDMVYEIIGNFFDNKDLAKVYPPYPKVEPLITNKSSSNDLPF